MNRRTRIIDSPNAPIWMILSMLHMIRRRPRSRREIMEQLKISRATSARLFRIVRDWYGVGLEYDRNTDAYAIDAWGVIDPVGMDLWIKKQRRKKK